jgi:hypothetical protein
MQNRALAQPPTLQGKRIKMDVASKIVLVIAKPLEGRIDWF